MENKKIIGMIAKELGIRESQVEHTINLLDGGNTIPFIARYRKEVTGSLDEVALRNIEERLKYLRNLSQRKSEILRLIAEQDKLTPELEEKIKGAEILQVLEDLYLPFRPKRQTRASKAKEKGLEPLALYLFQQEDTAGDPTEEALQYVDFEKDLPTVAEVLQGARDIIAEWIAEDIDIRNTVRRLYWAEGVLKSEGESEEQSVFEMYYDYKEPVDKIPPHRILALNRGEKEGVLKVTLLAPEDKVTAYLYQTVITNKNFGGREHIEMAALDGYKRLLHPTVERETRNKLWEAAEEHATNIFAANLQKLLLQSPVKGSVIMGIDPAFRTGSKVVIVDQTGRLLDAETVFPHAPQNKWDMARRLLLDLIDEYAVNIIAIGNGTASRETEKLIVEVIQEADRGLKYMIVDEAGASVYSASPLAKEEFPALDVSMRGAVSIARRLMDPLAELVKIDPRSIGVGLYQHDIASKRLQERLEQVVESCVNHVGVDVNTASPALLRYVAGMNNSTAKAMVAHREAVGEYESRQDFMQVKGFGKKSFEQAAGFLRLYSSRDPLARTPIHPESYKATKEFLQHLGYSLESLQIDEELIALRKELEGVDVEKTAQKLGIGAPTLDDIIEALKRPGRDPREDLPKPIFRTNILAIEDLKEGMVLKGTIRNVVDFGAFVDIGVKEDGLIHISQLSDRYIKDPLEVVSVGDIVDVRVINVDLSRKRIGLSMKLD